MIRGMKEMHGSMAKCVVLYGDALVSLPSSNHFREVRYFNYFVTDNIRNCLKLRK